MPTRTIISKSFIGGLERLTVDEQGLVKQMVFDLQMQPDRPGFNLHRLEGADSRIWSARVNRDLRLILHRDGDDAVLCYVGHHDDAYEWASRRRIEVHEETGAAQLVVIDERVVEVVRRVTRVQPPEAPADPGTRRPFADLDDAALLRYGVPRNWLSVVRDASVDTFLNVIGGDLPDEAQEHLLTVAAGETPVIVPKPSVRDPFAHPDARRRFHILSDDDDAVRQALAAPWELWQLFLHPSQRDAVERDHAGPARVSGGPGTGKSVVAVHRAARLAKVGCGRVLLTTFSKTLASRLQAQVDLLLADHTAAVARVDVVHLHHRAVEYWRESHGRSPRFPKPNDLVAIVMEAMGDRDLGGFSNKFVEAEWEMVIEPHGITTWEEYAHVRRDARSVPLGRAQRERLWPVFERMRELMAAQGLSTWSDICWQVALGIDEAGAPPYAHVIADEVQDFGPAELRLLRSLAAEGVNDVFLAGDAHQRIYKPRTSFSRAGLEVRGRSTVLRLNYRTTEQIRRVADRLIFGGSLQADGEDPAAVSVFAGPEPEFRTFATVKQEIEAVAKWLKKLVSNGYRPAEIGIVARTHQVVEDRARRAVAAAGLQAVDLESDSVDASKGVGLGTMHRAKGLQFRAVAVIGAERGMMPLESVLQRQPDEPAQRAFIERERNLLYVACTRSRERLLVTSVREPSEFLEVVRAVRA